MGIKARRGLLLLAIISVVGALLLSVGVISPKKAEADLCGWLFCPPPPPPVNISIPDSGAANPYPSEINVQGLSGTITDVNVTLNGYSHGFPDDVAVQVVSPTGKSVLLMSDVGGPLPSGSASVSNINLTLDDEAANSLSDSTQLTTGTYKPTKGTTPTELPSGWEDNPVPNSWPPDAPDLTVSGSQLSSFDGTAPNGIWKLYVIDDTRFAQGAFAGGWSLELNNTTTINNTTTTPPETSITSAEDGSNSATSWFSSNEQGSTFQCQLSKDGTVTQTWAACTSPKSYSNLTSGDYKFEVKATDSDGNVDQTPASRNWTITSPPDTTAPTATAPKHSFTTLSTLGTTTVPVKLSWSATDNPDGSGIASYQLQQSVNGGAYTNVALPSATTTTISRSLAPGNTYRYRVAAKDKAGNLSAWASGPSFKLTAFQESSSAIVDTGTWTTSALSGAYGGSVQSASALGRNATFSVPAGSKNVEWVSYRGNRGKAQVWLDGVQQDAKPSVTGIQPFDLYSSSIQARKVVFSKAVSPTTSHKLEVRVLGQKNASSTSTRVDIDAFVTTS